MNKIKNSLVRSRLLELLDEEADRKRLITALQIIAGILKIISQLVHLKM